MKNLDFIALLIANTNKTKRIRTYNERWHTGVRRCPDAITERIGSVVHILDDCIEQLCNCDEHLLVYNFQMTGIPDWEGGVLCSMYMIVKSLSKIEETDKLIGRPLQIIVRDNGEVMNDTRALLLLDCLDEGEEVGNDVPILYGNFFDFHPLATFVAIWRAKPFDSLRALFHGLYDQEPCIQEDSVAFDTIPQACEFLFEPERKSAPLKCIMEMQGRTGSLPEIRRKGFDRRIVKFIHVPSGEVIPNKETVAYEQEIEQDAESIRISFQENDEH